MPFPLSIAANDQTANQAARLAEARYRQDQDLGTAHWNETVETLLSHRSVRSYLPTAVPASVVDLAVTAAQSAPTSSNLQAWSVIAVEDPGLKSRLNAISGDQRHVEAAPLLLVWLADLARIRTLTTERSRPSEGLDYTESLLLGVIDTALAAQNALTAFESLGFGTCYIGAIRNHPEQIAELLGLPPEVLPVFGMTVGYPDPEVATDIKPRLPRRTVLHRGRYNAANAGDLAAYDATMRGFQQEQALPLIDWTELVSQRIGTAKALKNRENIRAALLQLGFKLK